MISIIRVHSCPFVVQKWAFVYFVLFVVPDSGLSWFLPWYLPRFLRESEEAASVFGCDFSDLLESQASFIGDSLCDERDIL